MVTIDHSVSMDVAQQVLVAHERNPRKMAEILVGQLDIEFLGVLGGPVIEISCPEFERATRRSFVDLL